jgi:hypothetical protein
MKIIDLLNKIANGEEVPKKIKFYGKYYIWYDNEYTGNKGYCLEPLKSDSNSFLEINTVYDLNNEVEIIEEEKKIEKIGNKFHFTGCEEELANKIDEIIDYLMEKKQ